MIIIHFIIFNCGLKGVITSDHKQLCWMFPRCDKQNSFMQSLVLTNDQSFEDWIPQFPWCSLIWNIHCYTCVMVPYFLHRGHHYPVKHQELTHFSQGYPCTWHLGCTCMSLQWQDCTCCRAEITGSARRRQDSTLQLISSAFWSNVLFFRENIIMEPGKKI